MDFSTINCSICHLNLNEISLHQNNRHLEQTKTTKMSFTIRLDSELFMVFAEPRLRRTVNAAARCLNASVSGPPPTTLNS